MPHERAGRLLDKALAGLARGVGSSTPRTRAHLRLARFWLALSTFHFEALLEAWRQVRDTEEPNWSARQVCAVRLSDCLEGYGGRQTTEPSGTHEARLEDGYRAKRPRERVLAGLSPALRSRAERMISTAEDVMAMEGRSPWGWMEV